MKVSKRVLIVTSAAPSQTPFSTWKRNLRSASVSSFPCSGKRGRMFFIDNYLAPSDFLETDYLKANGIDYVGI